MTKPSFRRRKKRATPSSESPSRVRYPKYGLHFSFLHLMVHEGRYKGSFPVRLYEREEQIFVGSMKPVEPGSSGDGMRIPLGRYDPITGHGVTYRLLRFFQAIEGFHVVSSLFALSSCVE